MALYSGKYPRSVTEFNELSALIEKYALPGLVPAEPFIAESDLVRTQGSCFAQSITTALQQAGVNARNMDFNENVNSPTANEYLFRYVLDPKLPFANDDHAALFGDARRLDVPSKFRAAKAFIFTLGVAPFFVLKSSNVPIFNPREELSQSYEAVSPSAEATKKSITAIVSAVRTMNPSIKIVLTVSPVPLNRSFHPSAIVADCISKSTIRSAVAEFMHANEPGVYYWPSFEIVRWLGAHLPPVFGADDGNTRHVNNELIALIVQLFLKYYMIRKI